MPAQRAVRSVGRGQGRGRGGAGARQRATAGEVRRGSVGPLPRDTVERQFHSQSTHLSHPGFGNQGPELRVVLGIGPEVSRDVIQLFSPVP